MQKYDYSAFDEKDVLKYNGKLPGLPKLTNIKYLSLAFSAVIILALLPFFSSLSIYQTLLLCIIIVFFMYQRLKDGSENSIRTALFAQRNNLNYGFKGKSITKENIGSVLESNLTSNRIYGSMDGAKYVLGSSYGKTKSQTVMIVDLNNEYPHIVLDAKNKDLTTNLNKNFKNYRKIELEGNFPEYFNVYTSTNPTETLQILSPDLMARLIDYSSRADVEIMGNKLILFCNYKDLNKDVFEMFYSAADQILTDIGKNSNNSKVKFTKS